MSMKSTAVITGAYPTAAPSDAGLSGKTFPILGGFTSIDFKLHATAGSGTYIPIVWDSVDWVPLGSIAVDSALLGGYAFGRFSPGAYFTHAALWEQSAATLNKSAIGFNIR